MGTYQKIIECPNCKTKNYEYSSFSYLLFEKLENSNEINV